MTSLPQVSPSALKPGTNSADGPIGPTHGSFATVCRLYSEIPALGGGGRTARAPATLAPVLHSGKAAHSEGCARDLAPDDGQCAWCAGTTSAESVEGRLVGSHGVGSPDTYSRIVGVPANERTGAVASSLSASVRSNSNASDGPARVSERGVGGLSCPTLDPHAVFNPEAAPMARADSISADKAADERIAKRVVRRERLALNVVGVLIAAAVWYGLAFALPYHPEVRMPVSCFSMGC